MPDLIRGHVGATPIPTRPKTPPPTKHEDVSMVLLIELPNLAVVRTPAEVCALPVGALLFDPDAGRTYRRVRDSRMDVAAGFLNAQDWTTEGMLHGGYRDGLRVDFLWRNLTERPMVLLWVGER